MTSPLPNHRTTSRSNDRDRRLVAHPQRQPARDRQHRQRGDERHDASVGDRRGVDPAEQHAHTERAEDEREAPGVGGEAARDRGRGDHRADRQVDARRWRSRTSSRSPARRRCCSGAATAEQVVGGQERLALQHCAGDHQHHDDADERVLLQLDAPARQSERQRRRAVSGAVLIGQPPRDRRSRSRQRRRSRRRSRRHLAGRPRGAGARAPWRRRRRPRPRSRPSRMTRIRVQSPASSASSDETTTTPSPAAARSPISAVDLGLGADVDAARRLVEQQHPASAQQPAGEHDLLLVAAGELAHEPLAVVGHAC